MNRHVFTSRTRRPATGPTIELIDAGDAPRAAAVATPRVPRQGAAPVRSAAPPSATGSRWLRRTALVLAALGATGGGGFLSVSGPAAAGEPVVAPVVSHPVPAVEVPVETPVLLPLPTETELAALDSGSADAMATALRALRQREVTAAGLRAVDTASRRTEDVELQRHVICYRVRGGAPLGAAFDALPEGAAADEWSHAGAACLVEAIAARASEAPNARCRFSSTARSRSMPTRSSPGWPSSTCRSCRWRWWTRWITPSRRARGAPRSASRSRAARPRNGRSESRRG